MKKEITPIYNYGRWIVLCPKHGAVGAALAGAEYICQICHPKINAFMGVVRRGILQTVPDTSAQKTARLNAEKAGEIYTVVFPKDRKKIETALAKLPMNKRHWKGEDLETLKKNVKKTKHVIDNFEKRDRSLDAEAN